MGVRASVCECAVCAHLPTPFSDKCSRYKQDRYLTSFKILEYVTVWVYGCGGACVCVCVCVCGARAKVGMM